MAYPGAPTRRFDEFTFRAVDPRRINTWLRCTRQQVVIERFQGRASGERVGLYIGGQQIRRPGDADFRLLRLGYSFGR